MEMLEVIAREHKGEGNTPVLVRCDGEHLPFMNDVFDCVVCIRFLGRRIPDAVREKTLKEARRVSNKWLILLSGDLRSMGPFVRFKVFARKLSGRDVSKYRLSEQVLSLGWKEVGRFWILGMNPYVGVYQKSR